MYDNSQELISNPRWSLIVVDMCCYNFSFEILLWLYTIANWFENCLI
jgi:hypothetical protein